MKVVTSLSFIIFLTFAAFAQTANQEVVKSKRENASATSFLNKFEKRELKRAQQLSLSNEQFKILDDINDSYVTRYVSIKEDKSLSKKEKKSIIKQFQSERYGKFIDLLQPEQKIVWDSLKHRQQRQYFRKK